MRRAGAAPLPLVAAAALAGLAAAATARGDAPPELEFKQVERLSLDDVYPDPNGERAVELHFRALTHNGVPVKALRPADVELWQDEDRIDAKSLSVEMWHGRGAFYFCFRTVT